MQELTVATFIQALEGRPFCPEGRAVVARIAASRTDENIANRSFGEWNEFS